MLFQKLLYRSTGYIIQWGVTHVATSSTETETVMEVFKKSSYSTFSRAPKVAQSNFLWIINRPNTL